METRKIIHLVQSRRQKHALEEGLLQFLIPLLAASATNNAMRTLIVQITPKFAVHRSELCTRRHKSNRKKKRDRDKLNLF
jgi:hypothetical protein